MRTLAAGGTYISPTLASYLLAANHNTSARTPKQDGGSAGADCDQRPLTEGTPATASHPDAATLTERERVILGLVAAGETDRDIAEQLHISISTVRSHLDRIRHKTGRRRRPDLTRLAYQTGLSPDLK